MAGNKDEDGKDIFDTVADGLIVGSIPAGIVLGSAISAKMRRKAAKKSVSKQTSSYSRSPAGKKYAADFVRGETLRGAGRGAVEGGVLGTLGYYAGLKAKYGNSEELERQLKKRRKE